MKPLSSTHDCKTYEKGKNIVTTSKKETLTLNLQEMTHTCTWKLLLSNKYTHLPHEPIVSEKHKEAPIVQVKYFYIFSPWNYLIYFKIYKI